MNLYTKDGSMISEIHPGVEIIHENLRESWKQLSQLFEYAYDQIDISSDVPGDVRLMISVYEMEGEPWGAFKTLFDSLQDASNRVYFEELQVNISNDTPSWDVYSFYQVELESLEMNDVMRNMEDGKPIGLRVYYLLFKTTFNGKADGYRIPQS